MNFAHTKICVLLVAFTILFNGCGDPKAETYNLHRKKVVEQLRSDLEAAKSAITSRKKGEPIDVGRHAIALQSIIERAEIESSVFEDYGGSEEFDTIISAARKLKSNLAPDTSEAKKKFEKLKSAVNAKISTLSTLAKDPEKFENQVKEIEKLLDSADTSVINNFGSEVAELRSRLDLAKQMKARYEELVKKADKMASIGFFDIADGVLESFNVVPEFKQSQFAKLVDAKKDELKELRKTYEARVSSEDELPWLTMARKGEGLEKFQSNPSECFLPKRNYIEIEVEDTDDDGNESKSATMKLPGSWKNFVFELEFMMIRKGFFVHIRDDGDKKDVLDMTEAAGTPRSENVRIQVRVENDSAQILSFTNFSTKTITLSQTSGGSIVMVFPANSKVRIINCRVKNLEK